MNDPAIAAARTSSGDIMSMLSKAHGEFTKFHEPSTITSTVNNNNNNNNNNDLIRPSPMKRQTGSGGGNMEGSNDQTNAVADFFAKVGGGIVANTSAGVQVTTNHPSSSHASVATPKSATNPVLQQLFQGVAAVGGQATVVASADSGASGGTAPISIPGTASTQSHTASSGPGAAPMSVQELEGRFKENLHLSGSHKDDNPVLFNHLNHLQNHPSFQHQHTSYHSHPHHQPGSKNEQSLLSPQVFTSSHIPDSQHHHNPAIAESPSSRNFPGLFTPTTTTTSTMLDMKPLNGSEESLNGNIIMNNGNNISSANTGGINNTRTALSAITPLTQEQLAQAFHILLKKDEFIHQLHEAYVQALNQSLKGCL